MRINAILFCLIMVTSSCTTEQIEDDGNSQSICVGNTCVAGVNNSKSRSTNKDHGASPDPIEVPEVPSSTDKVTNQGGSFAWHTKSATNGIPGIDPICSEYQTDDENFYQQSKETANIVNQDFVETPCPATIDNIAITGGCFQEAAGLTSTVWYYGTDVITIQDACNLAGLTFIDPN